ncbi:MAG: phosphate ABC transporter permease PstA [Oscillospiraceae bacterium]|nr:phosphate ABC transporter permease PstA [Oscillospiraceae bacterium]
MRWGVATPSRNKKLSARRRISGGLLKGIVFLCAGVTVALLVGLLGFILYHGLGNINWAFLTTARSALKNTIGIFPNILFTLYIIITALLISLPIGVGASIYLNEYASHKRLARMIEFTAETLTGIPSIIFGLVGYLFFCRMLGLGASILSGALTLVVMVLPIIVRTTQEALKTVPDSYREGAVALGATKWYMIRTIILPSSLDGIVGGCILAIGRIVGESAALIFTAGVGYQLVTNYFQALGTSGGTLSVALYVYVYEQGEFEAGYGIAAILVMIVLLVNFATKLVKKKFKRI